MKVLDQKLLRLSEAFQCALHKVADEVSHHDLRYREGFDTDSSASWRTCRQLKNEILEVENVYDQI